jgi:hypothetical protein
MTNPNDEKLSAFADQVLNQQMDKPASAPTDDLRGLEETILRLHNSISNTELEEAAKKQMLVRLNARLRREQAQGKKSFWQKIFDTEWTHTQSRMQFVAAVGVIATLAAIAILTPGPANGSSNIGTAFNISQSIWAPIVLVGLIVFILWIKRKK